ncbi:MAG: sugar phosphate isomerase/epimerase [Phycisphaerales bacterium]|nr:sugar phosphate isomerase/epimerase [Phycisphaerales bacterium]
MPLSRLGVCSWSLRPTSPDDLVQQVLGTGLKAVQLALSPIVSDRDTWGECISRLLEHDVQLLSGMIEPVGEDYSTIDRIRETGGVRVDAHWGANEAMARASAVLAANAGMGLITLHAGFLPHDPSDPERATMVKRLQTLADICVQQGISLGLETGQENAITLLEVLGEIDRPNLGVNFDPANMVLYGMGDPIEAFKLLRPHVVQVHIKDARWPAQAGEWGTEVPVGEGVVDWDAFMQVAASVDREIDAIIEREAGDNRAGDIRTAVEATSGFLGS